MRHILVIGAGRSATNLINYLAEKATDQQLEITVADLSLDAANKNIQGMAHTRGIALDVNDADQRQSLIQSHDLVISMLPAHMHLEVAKDCLTYGKHMVTASYVSPAMEELDQEVRAKNLIFMNECGLYPGIDHMSAMKVIDDIRAQGGKMLLFESFTGGLIAPESDTNLWHYKFTWNPRNVVLAGQGGAAEFIQEGTYKYIPYHRLFRRTELLEIEGH